MTEHLKLIVIICVSFPMTLAGQESIIRTAVQGGVMHQAPEAHELSELTVVGVEKEGFLFKKEVASGRYFAESYQIGIQLVALRQDPCVFFVGQEVVRPRRAHQEYAAIGMAAIRTNAYTPISVRVFGARDSIAKKCKGSKSRYINAEVGIKMSRNNPAKRILKQIVEFNSHKAAERFVVTFNTDTEEVTIRKFGHRR